MKRVGQDVSGRSKVNGARRDVAGMSVSSRLGDVASYKHALGRSLGRVLEDPTAALSEDALLLADFTDFLEAGESEQGLPACAPLRADSDFRERLRGRLWRIFVHRYLGDVGTQH